MTNPVLGLSIFFGVIFGACLAGVHVGFFLVRSGTRFELVFGAVNYVTAIVLFLVPMAFGFPPVFVLGVTGLGPFIVLAVFATVNALVARRIRVGRGDAGRS